MKNYGCEIVLAAIFLPPRLYTKRLTFEEWAMYNSDRFSIEVLT